MNDITRARLLDASPWPFFFAVAVLLVLRVLMAREEDDDQ